MHSHSDYVLLVNPRAESKVRQGVTTEVIGNCGGSAAPMKGLAREMMERRRSPYGIDVDWETFDDYLRRLEEGVAVNVATLVGHGTVRRCVMDLEERAPSQGELEEMKGLVEESMQDGAFGLSSGLVYPPGRYADTDELVELCRVVARHRGFYASHIKGGAGDDSGCPEGGHRYRREGGRGSAGLPPPGEDRGVGQVAGDACDDGRGGDPGRRRHVRHAPIYRR